MSRSTELAASSDALIVLAKEPRPGFSKTRLAADVGRERAAALADAFARDTLDLAAAGPWDLLVAFAPHGSLAWFQRAAPHAVLFPQEGAGLGERLIHATGRAFTQGAARCVVIGTDCPHLERGRLEAAFHALRDRDACLGPAADGGYYLIGLAQPEPGVFGGIPWSTDGVRKATEERCRALGLTLAHLPEEADVDDADGLERLQRTLAERPEVAPRTRALVAPS